MKWMRQRCQPEPRTLAAAAFSPASFAAQNGEFDAAQASPRQLAQAFAPERLGFRGANVDTQHSRRWRLAATLDTLKGEGITSARAMAGRSYSGLWDPLEGAYAWPEPSQRHGSAVLNVYPLVIPR